MTNDNQADKDKRAAIRAALAHVIIYPGSKKEYEDSFGSKTHVIDIPGQNKSVQCRSTEIGTIIWGDSSTREYLLEQNLEAIVHANPVQLNGGIMVYDGFSGLPVARSKKK